MALFRILKLTSRIIRIAEILLLPNKGDEVKRNRPERPEGVVPSGKRNL